jgi:hypothetical protein
MPFNRPLCCFKVWGWHSQLRGLLKMLMLYDWDTRIVYLDLSKSYQWLFNWMNNLAPYGKVSCLWHNKLCGCFKQTMKHFFLLRNNKMMQHYVLVHNALWHFIMCWETAEYKREHDIGLRGSRIMTTCQSKTPCQVSFTIVGHDTKQVYSSVFNFINISGTKDSIITAIARYEHTKATSNCFFCVDR